MPVDDKIYLGVGIKLPILVVSGKPALSYGTENVEQSIISILSTPIGSRFFLYEYGSRLDELIFEPNDIVLEALLRTFIFEALSRWEKRAKFVDLQFNFSDAKVDCIISYRILRSNEINSFVYPFYRQLTT